MNGLVSNTSFVVSGGGEILNKVGGWRAALGIAVVVFAILIGVLVYFKPKAQDVVVMGPYVLTGASNKPSGETLQTLFDQSQLSNLGNNFTFSGFVYMDDTNAERIPLAGPKGDFRFKQLIQILGVGGIVCDPIHQMLRVQINPLTSSAILKREGPVNIDVDGFVAARWNQIAVCIEGRSVDVYLNGVLAKSALLENVPILYPVGMLLDTSPDFSGQAGLFQAWPRRLTTEEVARNYKRNVDMRGKPHIPDPVFSLSDFWNQLTSQFCKIGFCGYNFSVGPLQYVDYEYA